MTNKLGAFIAAYLAATGLSQTELAIRATKYMPPGSGKITQSYISGLVKATGPGRRPGEIRMEALARAMGVTTGRLYEEAGMLDPRLLDTDAPLFQRMLDEFYRAHPELNEPIAAVAQAFGEDVEGLRRWKERRFRRMAAEYREAVDEVLDSKSEPAGTV